MLSDEFARARAPVVQWDGEPAYAVYELDPVPKLVVVEFVAAKASPVQGIRMRMRGGLLATNDTESPDMLLWRDTAPGLVRVRIRAGKQRGPSLSVWNVWRGGLGVTQAWMGNAGMRVERSPDGRCVYLRCSDGQGPAAFDDLEVRLTVEA